jgi:hypothetical protein
MFAVSGVKTATKEGFFQLGPNDVLISTANSWKRLCSQRSVVVVVGVWKFVVVGNGWSSSFSTIKFCIFMMERSSFRASRREKELP